MRNARRSPDPGDGGEVVDFEAVMLGRRPPAEMLELEAEADMLTQIFGRAWDPQALLDMARSLTLAPECGPHAYRLAAVLRRRARFVAQAGAAQGRRQPR